MIIAGTVLLGFTSSGFFNVTFQENQFLNMLRGELLLEVTEQVQFSIICKIMLLLWTPWDLRCINNFIASLQEYEVLSMGERIEDHLEMEKVFKNGMII